MQTKLRDIGYRIGDVAGNWILSPPHGGFGYYVNHGPRDLPRIALTFDDGPCSGSTEELLDAMGELGVAGTFFCVGENVAMNPDIVRRLVDEGHVVGSHSQRHSRGAGISPRDTAHITLAQAELEAVLGQRPRLYRPPWGWLTPWEGHRLHSLGYTAIGWDVYTLDWQIPEPDPVDVAHQACADVLNGSIFCFHDGYPLANSWSKSVTTETIKMIVPELRDRGYEFVTVSDLLGIASYAPLDHE